MHIGSTSLIPRHEKHNTTEFPFWITYTKYKTAKVCQIKIEKQNKNNMVVNDDGTVKLLEFESSVSEENFGEIFS